MVVSILYGVCLPTFKPISGLTAFVCALDRILNDRRLRAHTHLLGGLKTTGKACLRNKA